VGQDTLQRESGLAQNYKCVSFTYREVFSAWKSQVGTSRFISAEKVKKLFNDIQLFPSETDGESQYACFLSELNRVEFMDSTQ